MVSWTLKFWQNYVYLYCSKLNIGYASDVFEDLFLSFSLSEKTLQFTTQVPYASVKKTLKHACTTETSPNQTQ